MLEAYLLVSVFPNTLKQLEHFYNIIGMMNKYISFVYIVCALVASVHCSAYDNGYSSSADVPSYALGSQVYAPSNYQPQYYAARSKYSVQPLSSKELYPGRNSYRSYYYAPTYSQVALPVIPSYPLAKLYPYSQQPYDASYAY